MSDISVLPDLCFSVLTLDDVDSLPDDAFTGFVLWTLEKNEPLVSDEQSSELGGQLH